MGSTRPDRDGVTAGQLWPPDVVPGRPDDHCWRPLDDLPQTGILPQEVDGVRLHGNRDRGNFYLHASATFSSQACVKGTKIKNLKHTTV